MDLAFLAPDGLQNPKLRVMGRVRLALSGANRFPTRLHTAGHCLERQVLTANVIEPAIAGENEALSIPLSPAEQIALSETLGRLLLR